MKKLVPIFLAAIFAVPAAAKADYYYEDSDSASAYYRWSRERDLGNFYFGSFFAYANQKLVSGYEKVNNYGLKIAYEAPTIYRGEIISLVWFLEGILTDGWESSRNVHLTVVHIAGAGGIRGKIDASEIVTLSANLKIGLDYEYVEIDDWNYRANRGFRDDDTIGIFYGAGVGAEFRFDYYWSLRFDVEFIGSTAEAGDTHAQTYVVFGLGAIFRF